MARANAAMLPSRIWLYIVLVACCTKKAGFAFYAVVFIVSKSNFLNDTVLNKSRMALVCIVGMFAGFLLSRVALSLFMLLYGVTMLRDVPPRQWLRQRWWLLGMAWVAMYAVSGLWSTNMDEWGIRLQTKLPFLLLPLAFAFQPRFSAKEKQWLTMSLAILLSIAALYSMSFFVTDPVHYTREYHLSHMLPTLPKKDHIRCSMAMALFVVWSFYAWPSVSRRGAKLALGSMMALIVVYLHLLAAKSGLVTLYLFVLLYGVYVAAVRRKLAGLIGIAAIPLAVWGAYSMMPTFRERVHFIDFTLYQFRHGDVSGNVGDIARLISYQLAGQLIAEHPLTGVGTGDMKKEMDRLYEQDYPQIPEYGRLLVHNQAMVVALGCGIPAAAVFLWWVFAPLARLRRNRQSFFFVVVWLILLLQLMIEPVLEIQYGVFMYLFYLLLFRKEVWEVSN